MSIDNQNQLLLSLQEENRLLKSELKYIKNACESSLHPSELEVFKIALDRVSDMVVMISTDGHVFYTNKKFTEVYGINHRDFHGKIYDVPYLIPSQELYLKRLQQIRDNGGSLDYTANYGPSDDIRTIHVSAFIVNVNNAEIIWFFMQDITSLVKSRDEYRDLNYLLEAILSNIPVYLFVKDVDDDLRYLYWNKAFVEHSKIPASDVIGRTDFEVFPDRADAEKFRADDLEVIKSHSSIDRHETYIAANGETRIVQTRKIIVPRDDKGPLLIGVSIDITNMQNIEQELVQERLRADQSDRLKSAFLANMSHEIRTPLNAIVGFSSLLAETDDAESKRMFSDIIKQNSDVLLQLINDILDLSKIEGGTLEYVRSPFDLSELFRNVYEMQKNRTHHGVKLVFANPDHDARVIINEDLNRVMQVVTNLINNAIKFTSKGEIRYGFDIKDGFIEVYVSDTGMGIAPDKIDKVFDRFVKLNAMVQGTGLGLPICKMIVNIFGGKIWVESEYGKGSTFRFTIPYDSAMGVKPEAKPAVVEAESTCDVPAPASDGEDLPVILVGEDVASNFLLLQAYIGKKYKLIWAKDGSEAVRCFKQSRPDLILMDIKMPNIDGLEAARLIRTYSKDIPIIGLSAFAFESDRKQAKEAGFSDYLTKPVQRHELERTITKYLNR